MQLTPINIPLLQLSLSALSRWQGGVSCISDTAISTFSRVTGAFPSSACLPRLNQLPVGVLSPAWSKLNGKFVQIHIRRCDGCQPTFLALVSTAGLEPAASCFVDKCSIRLSYVDMWSRRAELNHQLMLTGQLHGLHATPAFSTQNRMRFFVFLSRTRKCGFCSKN